jgi:hypothetical protein
MGVRPNPSRISTLSLTIMSCAIRLAASVTPPSSLNTISIFLPATALPRCLRNNWTAALASKPLAWNGPVIGSSRPIL